MVGLFGAPAALPQPSTAAVMMTDRLNADSYMTLYFPIADYTRMAAEQRTLTGDQSYRAAVQAWMAGPESRDLQHMTESLRLLDCYVSEGIAFVDFDVRFYQLTEIQRMIARACLTQTLTSFADIEYVQVMVNHQAMAYKGRPVGPAQRSDGDLRAWALLLHQPEVRPDTDTSREYALVLYFQDAQNNYLIPEIRRVEVEEGLEIAWENHIGDGLIATVVAELAKGPQDLTKDNTLSARLKLAAPPAYDIMTRRLTLDLSSDILPHSQDIQHSRMALGSLVLSLTQSLPDIRSVQFLVEGESLDRYLDPMDRTAIHGTEGDMEEDTDWHAADFAALQGYRMRLYFPNSDGKLAVVQRAVSGSRTDKAMVLAEETLQGPLPDEVERLRLMPGEDLRPYLLSAHIENGTAEIKLASGIVERTAQMEPRKLRLWAYALINGTTLLSDVRWVTLRVYMPGEAVEETLLHGVLGINTPLLPDPGLLSAPP